MVFETSEKHFKEKKKSVENCLSVDEQKKFTAMNTFEVIQMQLGILSIYPERLQSKFRFNWKNLAILCLFQQHTIATILFLLIEASTFTEISEAFFYMMTEIISTISYSLFVLHRKTIYELIDNLDEFTEKRSKQPQMTETYEQFNKQLNKLTFYMFFAINKLSLPIAFGSICVANFWIYFFSDSGSNSFQLPSQVVLPFNWRTPFGFFVAFSWQVITWTFIAHIISCVLCFLVALCAILSKILEDLKANWDYLNQLNRNKQNRLFREKLHNEIDARSQVQQFAVEMTHIFQYIILGFYLWSVLSICSTLLTLQINMTNMSGKTVAMIPSAVALFWSLALFYFFCQFGQRLTDHFSELEMAISECDWYLFPEETQRILPIIIVAYQRHVTLQGFGNISCTLETFKKLVNGAFSYFAMLRQTITVRQ